MKQTDRWRSRPASRGPSYVGEGPGAPVGQASSILNVYTDASTGDKLLLSAVIVVTLPKLTLFDIVFDIW